MTVEMCAGVWRTRAGEVVTVRPHEKGCGWFGSDGHHRWDDGRYFKTTESYLDLVAFVSLPEPEPQPQPEPQPVQPPRHEAEQPDAADTLTALREWAYTLGGMLANANEANNSLTTQLSTLEARAEKAEHSLSLVSDERDGMESRLQETREERDVWQTRAVQAEGRVKTLGQELATVRLQLREDRDRWHTRAKQAEGQASNLAQELVRVRCELREAQQQLTAAQEVVMRQRQGWEDLQQQLTNRVQQVSDLQAQLEAAVHVPDLRSDLERVAAERDAAREEVRGLQVRAEQAEGDARQATGKMRHLERESARWEAQAELKNNLLMKAEGAANALQLVILNIVREVSNHDD